MPGENKNTSDNFVYHREEKYSLEGQDIKKGYKDLVI